MKWKEKCLNDFPDVILSDCQIKSIEMKKEDVVVKFSEYGFFKKDISSNKYYRTDTSQIIVEQCDVEDIIIKEIRMQELSEDLFYNSMYDVEPKDFINNINTGKWKFEIIEEFYSSKKALYIGQIRTDRKKFKCCIKLHYKNLIYLWNELRYDYPF